MQSSRQTQQLLSSCKQHTLHLQSHSPLPGGEARERAAVCAGFCLHLHTSSRMGGGSICQCVLQLPAIWAAAAAATAVGTCCVFTYTPCCQHSYANGCQLPPNPPLLHVLARPHCSLLPPLPLLLLGSLLACTFR